MPHAASALRVRGNLRVRGAACPQRSNASGLPTSLPSCTERMALLDELRNSSILMLGDSTSAQLLLCTHAMPSRRHQSHSWRYRKTLTWASTTMGPAIARQPRVPTAQAQPRRRPPHRLLFALWRDWPALLGVRISTPDMARQHDRRAGGGRPSELWRTLHGRRGPVGRRGGLWLLGHCLLVDARRQLFEELGGGAGLHPALRRGSHGVRRSAPCALRGYSGARCTLGTSTSQSSRTSSRCSTRLCVRERRTWACHCSTWSE